MGETETEPDGYVICIRNDGYQASLEPRKVYRTLPDTLAAKHRQIRVIDESGEDYLYPDNYFIEVDLPGLVKEAIRNAA
jgi:hypothetical protein